MLFPDCPLFIAVIIQWVLTRQLSSQDSLQLSPLILPITRNQKYNCPSYRCITRQLPSYFANEVVTLHLYIVLLSDYISFQSNVVPSKQLSGGCLSKLYPPPTNYFTSTTLLKSAWEGQLCNCSITNLKTII